MASAGLDEPLRLRTESIVWRDADGEIVLLDLASSTFLSVNAAGAGLWHELVAGTDRRRLIDGLRDRFGLSEQQAAQDVEAFLETLRTRQLLSE